MDSTGWDERYRSSGLVWTSEPNRFVREYLADTAPGTAVDLGAGEGRNAVWLAELGWRVTAVDFSPVGLAKAQDAARGAGVRIDTAVADVAEYAPDSPVDLVLLSYLQILPEDRRRLLRRIPSWLRPGGAVLVVAHDESNVEHGWGGPPDPALCYDVETTAADLAPLRVDIAEVRQRDVADADRPALDTVVLAHRTG